MENSAGSKYTTAFGLSLAASSIVNALLVIVKETSPKVQAAMQKLTGSHWITHAIIVLVVFLLCGCLLVKTNNGRGPAISVNNLIRSMAAGVLIACITIIAFYLIGD
jgi:hypothetical protein